MPEARLRLLVCSFVLWNIVTIGVVGQMAFDYTSAGSYDTSCPVGDSSGGPSHWQWLLPHGVCDYPTTGHRSSDVLLGFTRVLVPLGWLVLLVGVILGLASHIRMELQSPTDSSEASPSVQLPAR